MGHTDKMIFQAIIGTRNNISNGNMSECITVCAISGNKNNKYRYTDIPRTFTYTTDHWYFTLGTQLIRCWLPNKNEIRPTGKAGFDTTDFSRFGP
jgi:hypothetical protein